jgi:hypothetical protein
MVPSQKEQMETHQGAKEYKYISSSIASTILWSYDDCYSFHRNDVVPWNPHTHNPFKCNSATIKSNTENILNACIKKLF